MPNRTVTGTVHIDPLSIKSYTANLPATHLISSSMQPASSHQRYELEFLVHTVENSVGGSFCSQFPFYDHCVIFSLKHYQLLWVAPHWLFYFRHSRVSLVVNSLKNANWRSSQKDIYKAASVKDKVVGRQNKNHPQVSVLVSWAASCSVYTTSALKNWYTFGCSSALCSGIPCLGPVFLIRMWHRHLICHIYVQIS